MLRAKVGACRPVVSVHALRAALSAAAHIVAERSLSDYARLDVDALQRFHPSTSTSTSTSRKITRIGRNIGSTP